MALNLCTESDLNTTVNINGNINTYLIDALASTTYTYNLPAITTDGQEFILLRTDGTTGIVNLTGNMNINGTIIATYSILPYTITTVVSLGGIWYIIYSGNTVSISSGIKNIFTAYFPSVVMGNHYTTFLSSITTVPYLGNGMHTIIFTCGTTALTTSPGSVVGVYSNLSVLLFSIAIPYPGTNLIYTLTPANIVSLSTTVGFIFISILGGSNPISLSSIVIYG